MAKRTHWWLPQDTYDYLGSNRKRDGDKLKVKDLQLENGTIVNAPILSDCPVSIECTIVDSIVTGSHEMFVGKIEYVHAKEALIDEEGVIDYSILDLI